MNPQFYLQYKIYNFQNVINQLVEGDKTVYEQAPQSVIIIDTEEPEYLGKFAQKEIVELHIVLIYSKVM